MLHSIHIDVDEKHPAIAFPMPQTLFVPALIWPDTQNRQAFEFDQADTLAQFFYLATHHTHPLPTTGSWESELAALFGFSAANPPLATLRLWGEPHPAPHLDAPCLLCADPVNLEFIQQSMVLNTPDAATFSLQEATQLIATLNEEFADTGKFFMGTNPLTWYFLPIDTAKNLPTLAACSRLLGRRIDADSSRALLDRDGLQWLNRIQMCLNNHPVNEARQAQGLPVINSVWPWGKGTLQEAQKTPAPFKQTTGEATLLLGLCRATETPWSDSGHPTHADLVTCTALAEAVIQDDLVAWQAASQQWVQTHLNPAWHALKSGGIDQLAIIAPDSHQTHCWILHANHPKLHPNWWQRLLKRPAFKHPVLAEQISQW